jgi:hypothetical protein
MSESAEIEERLVKSQHTGLIQELERLNDEVKLKTSILRDRRNERIAHLKFESTLDPDNSPIPTVSRSMIEEALAALRNYMETVGGYFEQGETGYSQIELPFDGKWLVDALKKADAYSALEAKDWELRLAVETGPWKDA